MSDDPHDQNAVPKGRPRRMALGFVALLIVALLFAGIAVNANNAAKARRDADAWLVHTFEALVTAESMKAAVNMSIRGERGYLITGDEKFLEPYRKGNADTPVLMVRLAELTRDNPSQGRHIAQLRTRVADFYAVLDRAIALVREGRGDEALAIVRTGVGKHRIDDVLATLAAIEDEEKALLAVRSAESQRANDAIDFHYYMLAVAGLALLLVAGAVGVSAMRSQRKVREIAEQLRITATTDELTGLQNRRAFMRALDIEVARAGRSGKPLTVAMADVDFFKRVNDRYGHAGGDEVLRSLARIFEAIMRASPASGCAVRLRGAGSACPAARRSA